MYGNCQSSDSGGILFPSNYWNIENPCQGNYWGLKTPCQGNYGDIKTPCQGNCWDIKTLCQGNYWDIKTPYMGHDWDILAPCMGLVAFSQSGKFTLKTQRNPLNIPFSYQIGNYQKFPVMVTKIILHCSNLGKEHHLICLDIYWIK